jgi:hypothetical protein
MSGLGMAPRLAAALIAAAFAAAPASAASGFDKVTGAYALGAGHNSISAHAGPTGASGKASTNIEGQGRVFSAAVSCMRVSGNRAAIELFHETAGYILAYYEDNGPAGAATATPDRVGNGPGFTATPQGCPDPTGFFGVFGIPVDSGNVVVTEGT